jgi:hypothetical protein
VQALVRSITFETPGDRPSVAPRQIDFQFSDGPIPGDGLLSDVVSLNVQVQAVNDRPSLLLSGSRSYRENAPPVQLSATASAFDADNDHFDGGLLTVWLSTGGEANDELSILTLGGIATSSNNRVLYGDLVIATYIGGYQTGNPLVIRLNSNADHAATTALVRAIAYRSLSEDPTEGPHVVSFVLNDGESDSLIRTRTVNVIAVNDPPRITHGGGTATYSRNTGAITLLPVSEVREDQPNFGGGRLTVTNVGAHANDRVLILGNFTVDRTANRVYQATVAGEVHIGNLNVGGGWGSTPLVVEFTAHATPPVVQQLVRSIRFRTAGDQASLIGERTINFQLTDSLGLTGNTAFKQVRVV